MTTTSANSRILTRGPRLSRPACFTLIELVTVIAIAAVLAAIAVGSYGGSIANQQVRAAAHHVIADMEYLREYAIASDSSVLIEFQLGNGNYAVQSQNTIPAPAGSPGDVISSGAQQVPYEARFISVDFGGDTRINFDRFGAPDSGGSITLSVSDKLVTILFDEQTGKGTIQ